ncbi:MAG: MoaD/ThiS family protein [Desulfurococcales archaeon]|nr:MoaD/ThiS family protein [Desulfurococcales archaeon]
MARGLIKAKMLPEGKEVEFEVEKPVKVSDLLKMAGLSSETAVVIRDGTPLLETDVVKPGERVEIVRVLSGGAKV